LRANRPASRQPASDEPRFWEHVPDVFGSVEDISDALVIREQHQFLLTDARGDVPAENLRGLGFYSHDTRHLCEYEFLLDGAPPLVLLSSADSGFSQEQVLGNYRSVKDGQSVGRGTIEILRERVLDRNLQERVRITNFNTFPVTIEPSYRFDADFADIFEVRGHKRRHPGTLAAPEVGESTICFRYLGLDGVWRRTAIEFDPAPDEIGERGARFAVTLRPRETFELRLTIDVDEYGERPETEGAPRLRREYREWRDSFAAVHTDSEVYNRVLDRSLTDLRMLWTREHAGHSFLAAGTPWFSALFGRDSIIASLQTLPFRPEVARECLSLLARYQGQTADPYRCEEPGKILHEMRHDELSTINELPYQRYYGSVDSTPLFLLLAAEYAHWTADLEFIDGLMPCLNAALHWVLDYGDSDGDGFLDYTTESPGGLRNQGWKDSLEAIVHADGSLCEGPIALAEVQGYLYLALTRLAPVLAQLGDTGRAQELREAAHRIRKRFATTFWRDEKRLVAMALDGSGQPAEVMSSNAGQVLWSGLLAQSQAASVKDALFASDMFSGWGIRTLSYSVPSYYPLGYHVGTVWPHDNGIIALGLKRYGFDNEVNEIATSLLDAAREFPSYRLPELFGGQPRSEFQPPVPYPVACRPQTWTAGCQLHILQAMLGLHADGLRNRLQVIRPRLPYWLTQVHIGRLRVGEGSVDLHFRTKRGKTSVTYETTGPVKVEVKANNGAFFSD
jgi:glycogen debranching enzyme